jgi:hypothetical protein
MAGEPTSLVAAGLPALGHRAQANDPHTHSRHEPLTEPIA